MKREIVRIDTLGWLLSPYYQMAMKLAKQWVMEKELKLVESLSSPEMKLVD